MPGHDLPGCFVYRTIDDLERIRSDFASDEIAGRFFSHREVAALRALSPGSRAEAFFNCWTRKEAYIKARGMGLSIPLEFALGRGGPSGFRCQVRDGVEEAVDRRA